MEGWLERSTILVALSGAPLSVAPVGVAPAGCGPAGCGSWALSQGAEVAVGGEGGECGQGDAQGVPHAGCSHGELPLPVPCLETVQHPVCEDDNP